MRHTVAISGLLQMWFMLNRASVAEVWQSAEENGIFFFLGRACRRCLIFTNWSLESSHMTRVKLFFFFFGIRLPSTIVPLFIRWINAAYIGLLSIGLFVCCKPPCVLTFPSPCLSRSNFQLHHDSLSRPKDSTVLQKKKKKQPPPHPPLSPPLPPPPPKHQTPFPPPPPVFVGVKLAISFFLSCPLQNVEVFYWRGEKQWGQGRALWWQKCIFNPCEWMVPHIPQQQALYWMAALTRLFSLLITALCLFTTDIVIYLHQLSGGFDTIETLS